MLAENRTHFSSSRSSNSKSGLDSMQFLFSSGHIADLILALIVIETAILMVLRGKNGRGLSPRELIAGLVPGAFLLLAVRTALTGCWWGWTAAALAASGIAHVIDMTIRIRTSYKN